MITIYILNQHCLTVLLIEESAMLDELCKFWEGSYEQAQTGRFYL